METGCADVSCFLYRPTALLMRGAIIFGTAKRVSAVQQVLRFRYSGRTQCILVGRQAAKFLRSLLLFHLYEKTVLLP
jgi:hypothetical protein